MEGAAGAVEASYCIMSIMNNKIPYNLNLEKQIPSKKINFVKDKVFETELNNVMSNSFGFGGTNVSLIFSRYNNNQL